MNFIKTISIFLSLLAIVSCGGKKKTTQTTEAKEAANTADAAGRAILSDETHVMWEAYKFVGDGHAGSFSVSEGELFVENDMLVGGKVMIDMAGGLSVTDIPKEDDNYGKLVGHLQSDDFFNVAQYPTASFEITSVKANAEKPAEEGAMMYGYVVMGNLMLKGVSKNVTFKADINVTPDIVSLESEEFLISGAEWGVFNEGSNWWVTQGKKNIKDEIKIKVMAQAL